MAAVEHLFRRMIAGRIAAPGDECYDELRKPWLTLVDPHPALVVEAGSVADVAATIRLARDHGLELGVMATGHGIAATCDGGVLLRLGRLDSVEIDASRGVARIGPGVTSGKLLEASEPHGFLFPAGQADNVGVTGFSLGGGLGWMARKLGPASSSIRVATVVLADGSTVRASADDDIDLLWALRGGGGNFGVVVELEMELSAAPHVYGGELYFPISRAAEVLRAYRDWSAGLSEEVSSVFRLMALPVGWMPRLLDGLRLCMIGICHADPAHAAADLKPLEALGKPLYHNLKQRPLSSMAKLDPASHLSSSAGYAHAEYLRSLSDDVIDRVLAAAGPRLPPLSQLEIQHLGGKLAKSGPDGAFEPFLSPYLLHLVTPINPLDPLDRVARAAGELCAELRADLTGQAYLNYLRWDEQARVPMAYTPEKLKRLRSMKQAYDPDNLFRLNLNIAPSAGSDAVEVR